MSTEIIKIDHETILEVEASITSALPANRSIYSDVVDDSSFSKRNMAY